MVPGHLVPHNWSPIDWSLWINSPQPIQSPWTNGPPKFGPHGQMVPTNLVLLDKWSLEYSIGPGGQAVGIWKYGDQIGWGPFVQGDQILGDHLSMGTKFDGDRLSRGPNWLGTICPWEPNFLGPFVHGDRKWGTESPGIKWLRDQMSRSRSRA